MFLSKIWLFLVAVAAAAALAVALLMPRPAQREVEQEEKNRLGIACSVIDIVLADNARSRVELAGSFARAPKVVTALESASAAAALDEARMKQVRDVAGEVMKGVSGHGPDFAMLVDNRGRVVARVTLDENEFGDIVAGRPLVDDALAGYLRDDIWAQNGTMYLVSAAPVVRRDPPVAYVGAIVLGNKITSELAKSVVGNLDVDLGFYLGANDVAESSSVAFDHKPMLDAVAKLTDKDLAHDCRGDQFELHSGSGDFTGVVARLPGEAEAHQAFFTVFMQKRAERGFAGTWHALQQGDMSFGHFPWLLVAGLFVLALGGGIALMWLESDRPLRALQADALGLAKHERERLSEDRHGGKYGSIARSVNIHVDKVARDSKAARAHIDPLSARDASTPSASAPTIDLLAGTLPVARPGGVATAAPPPSEFKFSDGGARPTPPSLPAIAAPTPPPPRPTPPQAAPMIAPPAPTPAPAPAPAAPPPKREPERAPQQLEPMPVSNAAAPLRLDDDILGGLGEPVAPAAPPESSIDPYFKSVFDQFIAVKKSCGEPIAGLTYAKFTEKLVKNKNDLIAKTGCRDVRFTVYVKDGKAALKATPVKDD